MTEWKQYTKNTGSGINMKEIKDVNEAIAFLETKAGINVEIVDYKYRVSDNDFDCRMTDDKELIDYANEQMEAIGEDEEDELQEIVKEKIEKIKNGKKHKRNKGKDIGRT